MSALVLLFAANLIFNSDFTLDDGLGGVAGWSVHNASSWAKPADWKLNSPEMKPIGDGAVTLTFVGREPRCVRQNFFTLAPGGRYRFSAEVRTAGLSPAKVVLSVSDVFWRLDCRAELPDDTKGEWTRVEKTFAVPSGAPLEECAFRVYCFPNGSERTVLDVRRPALEPLDAADDVARPVDAKYVLKRPQRIVPIEPSLFDVSTADGKLTFYWPVAATGGLGGCVLKASVDGGAEIAAPFGADGRATVAFGKLVYGEHAFKVRVIDAQGTTLAANDYRGIARAPRPFAGPTGRKLNNFVTELVNAPLENGPVKFFRPTDGWVWISFDGDVGDARGYLDGKTFAVVRPREGETRRETQRYVSAGWHALEVRGAKAGGRLRIHAVKVIAGNTPDLRRGPCLSNGDFTYTLPFMRRFDGFVFNTLVGAQAFALTRMDEATGYFRERGIRLIGGGDGCGVFHPKRQDQRALYDTMASQSWRAGIDVIVDENPVELWGRWGAYVSRYCDWIYSENVWRMNAENPFAQVNTYYSDTNYGSVLLDRESKTSEISAIVNSGRGTGMLVPEAYAPSFADSAASGKWEDYFARFLRATTDFVPAARGKTLFWMAPYVTIAGWSSHTSPEVDLKAHYSRLMFAFATKPEFADIGGLGFGGITAANDEVRRWGHRLLRHYCLEGATDDLAVRLGYAWAPGIVKNPDFADGLTHWTLAAAEADSLAAETVKNYGALQGRQNRPAGIGDGMATFTTVAQPNRLSQKLMGLKPGAYYALEFTVADRAGIETKAGAKAPVAFSAVLTGAEEVKALRYRRLKNAKGRPQYANERYVFKATAAEATLVLTDREADGTAAPPGTKQAVNHIDFHPFYLASPDELPDVIDFVTTVQ